MECEVQRECLDFAVITKSDEGIFGGYTPQERKLLQDNYEKVLELQAKERNDKQQGRRDKRCKARYIKGI